MLERWRKGPRDSASHFGQLQKAVVGTALLVVVGGALAPGAITLTWSLVAILGIAAVIALAPLLLEAELPGGTRFKFREKIEEAEEAKAKLEKSVTDFHGDTIRISDLKPYMSHPGLLDVDDELRELAVEQPAAALGALRAEIRNALRSAVPKLCHGRVVPSDTSGLVDAMKDSGKVRPEQVTMLRVLIDAIEAALLSGEADTADAHRLIALADTLNMSFPLGYSPNFEPNDRFEDDGLICEFEHCIENMPLPGIPRSERIEWRDHVTASLERGDYDGDPQRKAWLSRAVAEPIPEDAPETVDTTGACPIFGHYCPGGAKHVEGCEAAQSWRSPPPASASESIDPLT